MSNFYDPIQPPEPVSRDDHIIISPIEADKKIKEEMDKQQNEKNLAISKSAVYLTFLSALKKSLLIFSSKRNAIKELPANTVVKDILKLKELLSKIKERDQSDNPQFCQEFSKLWHCLVYHSEQELTLSIKTVNLNKIETFIKEMRSFPPNEEHPLSYYLSEYAGTHWLPLPFIEMLKMVRHNYLEKRDTSFLQVWLNLLSDSLKPL